MVVELIVTVRVDSDEVMRNATRRRRTVDARSALLEAIDGLEDRVHDALRHVDGVKDVAVTLHRFSDPNFQGHCTGVSRPVGPHRVE